MPQVSDVSTRLRSFTVADLATRVGGELLGPGNSVITGLQTVHDAKTGDLTFVGDDYHAKAWPTSSASVAVVSRTLESLVQPTEDRAIILVPNADTAMISILDLFAPEEELPPLGVHPTALIDPSVVLGHNVRIAAGVHIARGCVIGAGVSIFPGTCLYHSVTVGDDCVLHAGVVIRERCVLGRSVVLHGGVQIGTDGFGYRASPDGRGLLKVPHLGNVIIEDGVEVGANSCIDRGKFGATLIGASTKIDNLVQIGHNCRIGRCVVICGLAGVAGSSVIADGVRVGGGVGIADHVRIGRGASIAGGSGVMNDIPDGESWAGYPAKEARRAMQEAIVARKLPELMKNLKEILGPEASRLLDPPRDRSRERPVKG